MTTRDIDVMLSRPGIYLICTRSAFFFVEVEDGRCYQLELGSGAYARDGELTAGRWIVEHIAAIHGPFARASTLQSQRA